MNFLKDLNFENILIIVKKTEPKSFFYKSLRRGDDGFIYILSGSGGYSDAKNGEIKISEGSLLILEKDNKYNIWASGENFSYITTMFHVIPHNAFSKMKLPVHINFSKNSDITEKFEKLLKVWENRSQFFVLETRTMLNEIMLHIFHYCASAEFDNSVNTRISEAISYINKNCTNKISIRFLAQKCMMSDSYFRKVFTRQVGMSPITYKEYVRIDKAKSLLASELFNITEVAEKLGYCDIYYFSKEFKKYAGVSPLKYRKKVFEK